MRLIDADVLKEELSSLSVTIMGLRSGSGAIIVRCRTCAASAYGCFYNGEEIEIPLEITVGGGKATYAWNRRAL